jgi:PqqD family protein of HPr-rel-A system
VSGPVYRAAPPEALRSAPLDGLTVLFHRASGQTHLVTEPVPEILAALQQPMTIPDLLAHLGLEEEDRAALDARVAELLAIGLVWSA